MSNVKNLLDDQDPDYTIPISTNKNQEEVCEENGKVKFFTILILSINRLNLY